MDIVAPDVNMQQTKQKKKKMPHGRENVRPENNDLLR